MYVIGHIEHGPGWKKGLPVTQQGAAMAGHLAFMKDLYDRGSLLLGGPYEAGEDGGLAVFVADSLSHAQLLADADPAARAGVVTYRLSELRAVFDRAGNLDRSAPLQAVMAAATPGAAQGTP